MVRERTSEHVARLGHPCYGTIILGKGRNVQIGERYREAGTDAFGQPRRRSWRVENIYTGVGGLVYAHLAEEADGASKTIAESVLLDRSFYIPTE